jgi:phosphatidylglycerophosphate synthase
MRMAQFSWKDCKDATKINAWTVAFLLDPIIIATTWLLVNLTRITPNVVTFVAFLFTIASAYFFLTNHLILGAVFFLIRWILDNVDGKIARLKDQGTKFGAFFDNYTGRIGFFMNTVALCFGQYGATGRLEWLLITPLLYFLVSHHGWESTQVGVIIGEGFLQKLSGKSEEKGLIPAIKNFLNKHKLTEPFSTGDLNVLLYFIPPVFLQPWLFESIVVISAIILCQELFWFYYYTVLLKREGKLPSPKTVKK